MAYEYYVTITGEKQGAFKGETPRESQTGKIPCLAFDYGVQSPRDVATGQPSGKRQHQPITITKEWGASTPQIFQALTTNERLPSVLFEFVRTTPEGLEEVHHTIKLTNATISSVKQYVGTVKHENTADTHELEDVSFTFQQIDLDNKGGSTSASDNWNA